MHTERFDRKGIQGTLWYGSPIAFLAHLLWGVEAVTIGHTIHVLSDFGRIGECGLMHELVHIKQWDAHGWRFLFKYRRDVKRFGYEKSQYEMPALDAQEWCEAEGWGWHDAFLTPNNVKDGYIDEQSAIYTPYYPLRIVNMRSE